MMRGVSRTLEPGSDTATMPYAEGACGSPSSASCFRASSAMTRKAIAELTMPRLSLTAMTASNRASKSENRSAWVSVAAFDSLIFFRAASKPARSSGRKASPSSSYLTAVAASSA